jgi:hypothetical protein
MVISIYLVSISLDDLNKNLDTAKSQLKSLNFKNLNREKKVDLDRQEKSRHFKKVSLDTKDFLDLDWSRLSRPPGLHSYQGCWRPDFWGDGSGGQPAPC